MNVNERFKIIRESLSFSKVDFAKTLDIPQSTISEIEKNKIEPSKPLLIKLNEKFNIDITWLLTGKGEPFINEKKEEQIPVVSDLEKAFDTRIEKTTAIKFEYIDKKTSEKFENIEKTTADKFENIESQLIELKKEIEKLSAKQRADDGTELQEPEPPYCHMLKIPFVDNIAAGSPIEQNYIQGTEITIPKTLIKGNANDYYTARIAGESMTESGIFNGDVVLIKKNEEPIHSKIQVVRYKNKSTLKRLCKNGETWELHFEDGTNRVIPVHENDYQVQGDFIAVINKFVNPA